ncbi:hypothetical protein JOM56_001274 [Amanita muscaria]
MLQHSKYRCHIIYTDTSLNGEYVVHLNIYQNFLLLAMKMHTFLRARGLGLRKNESFIFRTVQNVIHHTYMTMKTKCRKKVATDNDGACNVQKDIVVWQPRLLHCLVAKGPGLPETS